LTKVPRSTFISDDAVEYGGEDIGGSTWLIEAHSDEISGWLSGQQCGAIHARSKFPVPLHATRAR
jgi:hypothetical protein